METNVTDIAKKIKTKAEIAAAKAKLIVETAQAQAERIIARANEVEIRDAAFKAREEEVKTKSKQVLTEKAIAKREKQALKRKGLWGTPKRKRKQDVDISNFFKGTPIKGKSLKKLKLLAADGDIENIEAKVERIVKKTVARKLKKDIANINREREQMSRGARLVARAEMRRKNKRPNEWLKAKIERQDRMKQLYAELPATHKIVVRVLGSDDKLYDFLTIPCKTCDSIERLARLTHMEWLQKKQSQRNSYVGTYVLDMEGNVVTTYCNPVYMDITTKGPVDYHDKSVIKRHKSAAQLRAENPKHKMRQRIVAKRSQHAPALPKGMLTYLKNVAEKQKIKAEKRKAPAFVGNKKYSGLSSRVRRRLSYAKLMETHQKTKIKELKQENINVAQAA